MISDGTEAATIVARRETLQCAERLQHYEWFSFTEVKALDPDKRASVLAVVERAVAARTADDLAAFLEAARK